MRFLRLSVTEMSNWLHWAASQGFIAISELDYKEQMNNPPPPPTPSIHISQLTMSGSHTNEDGGLKPRFGAFTTCMRALIEQEKHQVKAFDTSNTKIWCPWLLMNSKTTTENNNGCFNCIPMGGPFSAQGADLHSVCGAYHNGSRFHKLGRLDFGGGMPSVARIRGSGYTLLVQRQYSCCH